MAKKRLTPNQKEYKRQVANLRRRMNSAIKEGFVFTPEQYELLEMPDRVTQKVLNNLKKQNRKLWNQSQPARDRITGIVYGDIRQAREAERESARERTTIPEGGGRTGLSRSDLAIAAFMAESGELIQWAAYATYGEAQREFISNIQAVTSLVQASIQSQGIDAVARALEGVQEDLGQPEYIAYENVRTVGNMQAWANSFLSNLFPDNPDLVKDTLESAGLLTNEDTGIEPVEDTDMGE